MTATTFRTVADPSPVTAASDPPHPPGSRHLGWSWQISAAPTRRTRPSAQPAPCPPLSFQAEPNCALVCVQHVSPSSMCAACRYRTEFCTYGTACSRAVCFFAHTEAQLRTPGAAATPIEATADSLNQQFHGLTLSKGGEQQTTPLASSPAEANAQVSSAGACNPRPGFESVVRVAARLLPCCGAARAEPPGSCCMTTPSLLRNTRHVHVA
jgi:hypothetical protein